MNFRRCRHPRSRALTVVELLVLLAVFALVGGLIFSVFHYVDADARHLEHRDAVLSEAQLIYRGLSDVFRRNAMRALDTTPAGCVWAADRCAFAAIPPQQAVGAKGLCLYEISAGSLADAKSGSAAQAVRVRQSPLPGSSGAAREWRLGAASETCESRIEFRYAVAFRGIEPVWLETLAPEARPRLVKATITVRSPQTGDATQRVEAIFEM